MNEQELLKEFKKILNWKDCGDFKVGLSDTVRDCIECGFPTQWCGNCKLDHHTITKLQALEQLFSQHKEACREETLSFIIDLAVRKYPPRHILKELAKKLSHKE